MEPKIVPANPTRYDVLKRNFFSGDRLPQPETYHEVHINVTPHTGYCLYFSRVCGFIADELLEWESNGQLPKTANELWQYIVKPYEESKLKKPDVLFVIVSNDCTDRNTRNHLQKLINEINTLMHYMIQLKKEKTFDWDVIDNFIDYVISDT